MKVDVTDLSPVKKSMAIEVGPDVVEKETKAVLRDYASKARVPGFRRGKVPLDVIRARFAQEVREDVRDRVVARSYKQAAEQEGLEPIGDPVLEDLHFEAGEPLRFKTVFEVLPRFELKGYRGIEVRRPASSVAEEEIDRALEETRQAQTKLVATEGRAAGTGDVIVTDIEGTPEGGETFRREGMLIEVGAQDNLPAFNEHLEGATVGQSVEFAVDYPQEYQAEALAGKSVRYHLEVREIKRREVPELDDELAKDLGLDDLAALRKELGERLRARREHEAERKMRESLLDKVLLENPVLLPESLVQEEVRRRMEDMVRSMILQGMDPEKAKVDWEAMRKDQELPARKSVHARLVLDAVAVAESISVETSELDARIREDARRMGEKQEKLRQELQKHGRLEALKNQIVREKSLDLLTSVANIQNEE